MTRNLLLAITVCVVTSSFQTGFNNGVVNTPEKVIKRFIHDALKKRYDDDVSDAALSTFYGLMVSIFSGGAILGSLIGGNLSNRLGRKRVIVYGSLLSILGLSLQVSSRFVMLFEFLVVGRFLSGVTTGIMSVAVSLFSSETAPVRLRGLSVTISQLSIGIGYSIATAVGMKDLLGTDEHWQYAIGLNLIPVIYQLCIFYWIPESPRFLLLTKDRKDEAIAALRWFRGKKDVVGEIHELLAERDSKHRKSRMTVYSVLKDKSLRKPLLIAVSVILVRQFSGIHAVIYYSTSIYTSAGLSDEAAQFASLGTSLVTLPMLFISALVVDRLGRRTLLLLGLVGMLFFSVALTFGLLFQEKVSSLSYLCVTAVVCFSVAFSLGPAAVPKVLTTELFTQRARATAVSLTVTVSRTVNLIVGFIYPLLQTELGHYSFLPFVACLVVSVIYTFIYIPETKGKTYSEISILVSAPSTSTENNSEISANTSVASVSVTLPDPEIPAPPSYAYSTHL